MPPFALTPIFLPLSMPNSASGFQPLVVQRLRDAGDGVGVAGLVVAAVENDHHLRASGDGVVQAGARRHRGDVELAGDHRRHRQRPIHEHLDLDVEVELLEIALVARDVECPAGDEGSLADADLVGGANRIRGQQHDRRSDRPQAPSSLPILLIFHPPPDQRSSCATHGASLRSSHCCNLMMTAPITASTTRLANTFSVSIT